MERPISLTRGLLNLDVEGLVFFEEVGMGLGHRSICPPVGKLIRKRRQPECSGVRGTLTRPRSAASCSPCTMWCLCSRLWEHRPPSRTWSSSQNNHGDAGCCPRQPSPGALCCTGGLSPGGISADAALWAGQERRGPGVDIRAGQRTAPAATCGEGHARSHRIRRPLTSLESWEQMADNELEGRTQHPTSHTVKEAPPLSVRAGPRGEGLTLPLQARASGPGPAGLLPGP